MKLKTDYTEKEQFIISELENYAKMLNNFYDFVGNLPFDLYIDILVYSKYLQNGKKSDYKFPYINQETI